MFMKFYLGYNSILFKPQTWEHVTGKNNLTRTLLVNQ